MSDQDETAALLNNDFRWREMCELHASANALQFAAALTSLLIEYKARVNLHGVLERIKQRYHEHFHACFDDRIKNIQEGEDSSRNNQNNLSVPLEDASPINERHRARSQSEGMSRYSEANIPEI